MQKLPYQFLKTSTVVKDENVILDDRINHRHENKDGRLSTASHALK